MDGHCPSAGGMQANPGADGSRAWSGVAQGPGPTLVGSIGELGRIILGVGGVPAFFCRRHFCLYLVNWVGRGHHPSTDEETESRETGTCLTLGTYQLSPWHLGSLAPTQACKLPGSPGVSLFSLLRAPQGHRGTLFRQGHPCLTGPTCLFPGPGRGTGRTLGV